MNNQVYSYDETDWTYSDKSIEEVINGYFENQGETENGEITLYVGEAVGHKASEFLPHIWDEITNQAYDVAGEHSEDWCYSLDKESEQCLQKQVERVVDQYFKETKKQPSFFKIKNDKPIKVRIIGESTEYPYFQGFEVVDNE